MKRKTLCRADIVVFTRATAGRRFHDNWDEVHCDLVGAGMTMRQIIILKTSCIRHVNARSSGEPGAIAFNAEASDAIVGH